MLKRALGLDLTLDIRCCDDWTFNIFSSSHISILPFLHDSSLDSKLSTGHTFSDICMTSRHETMTWHDGVMRLARVTGSCHGLRDSIVTLRDGAVTSAVSATALPLCSYHYIVCNIRVYSTWWELFTKVMDWLVHSFAPMLSIPGLVSETRYQMMGALWIWAEVMWPAIMRLVWAWPRSAGNGAMVRANIVSRERLRDGVTPRDMWQVMCDVLTDTRPLSLGAVSALSAY